MIHVPVLPLSRYLFLSPSSFSSSSYLQGGSKRPETVMQVVRGAWAMLTKNTGSVRVDFAQPFSLQVQSMFGDCVL